MPVGGDIFNLVDVAPVIVVELDLDDVALDRLAYEGEHFFERPGQPALHRVPGLVLLAARIAVVVA